MSYQFESNQPIWFRKFGVDSLLLIVAGAWGSTYLVAKLLISESDVVGMLSSRMTLAAICFWLIVILRKQKIAKIELKLGTLYGVILASVFASETFGIANTTATNAGLIISLTIVFTPFVESFFTRTKILSRYVWGGIIAFSGVWFLASGGHLIVPNFGDIFMLIAAVLRALHVSVVKSTSQGRIINSLNLSSIQLSTTAIIFILWSMVLGVSPLGFITKLDSFGFALFVYLVVGCTVFPFFVQIWAIRKTSATHVSLLLGTEPVWAALIGVTIAGDHLNLFGWIGIALILGAIFGVQYWPNWISWRSSKSTKAID